MNTISNIIQRVASAFRTNQSPLPLGRGWGWVVALLLFASCTDDDYKNIVKQGDPLMDVAAVSTQLMGDSLTVPVTCSDRSGVSLSTLTAELLFGTETVSQTTLRTPAEGEYDVRLLVPYLQYVPNGDATLRLTLQNVTTSTTVMEVKVPVERPHFADLQFITADSTVYQMTEQADYTYTTTVHVDQNGFKGHFLTRDGQWAFGSDGATVALGQTANLEFQTAETGDVEVTLNTRDFTFGPVEDIPVVPLNFTEADNVVTRDLVQGNLYTFGGITDDWFTDGDFFEDNGDGTYTFLALSGTYTVKAVYAQQGFRIHAGTADAPATLQADGTGAIWIIGDNVYGKPTYADAQGWWTDTDHALCLAPVREKVHQVTLTVGRQLKAGTSTNFKFFGQAGWGTEFKGADGDYLLSCDNDVFGVGDGNGHDNGNIYLRDGAELVDGDTYVFTIDLTGGVQNGRLIIKKQTGGGNTISFADGRATQKLKKGTAYTLDGIGADWFVDYDFFKSNSDGTYTFLAVSGTYTLAAYDDYKYVQIYPSDADGNISTLQADGTGSIWIIGSECVSKPSLASENNHGWWTDPQWNICLAPVADRKYQVTLTVGQQLATGDINFKFFGQPTWGTEFNGQGGDYHLDTDNEWFRVNAADSDNGNIFLRDGATLSEGDTFQFTIDLTAGVQNGVLTVVKL